MSLAFTATLAMVAVASGVNNEKGGLYFAPASGQTASLTMHDGRVVRYTAYTRLYYVTNVEDSTYQ